MAFPRVSSHGSGTHCKDANASSSRSMGNGSPMMPVEPTRVSYRKRQLFGGHFGHPTCVEFALFLQFPAGVGDAAVHDNALCITVLDVLAGDQERCRLHLISRECPGRARRSDTIRRTFFLFRFIPAWTPAAPESSGCRLPLPSTGIRTTSADTSCQVSFNGNHTFNSTWREEAPLGTASCAAQRTGTSIKLPIKFVLKVGLPRAREIIP